MKFVTIGKKVVIADSCSIGNCIIGDHVKIGRGVIIDDGVTIGAHCIVKAGCIIGNNSTIGS
ncbi:MAG: hypothetical protein KDD48_05830, partial [Bdellovibrionales bacterium]|nr:hypothetical protein [Bdellovibrionales bacterium]